MAGFDAIVACHDSKYTYWVPRPAQADPKITLAVGVPNHPSYPANHACISGAMGRVLDAQIPGSNGVFESMGKEAGASRLYGGIPYRMDVDAGDEIARKIAERALQSGPAKGADLQAGWALTGGICETVRGLRPWTDLGVGLA